MNTSRTDSNRGQHMYFQTDAENHDITTTFLLHGTFNLYHTLGNGQNFKSELSNTVPYGYKPFEKY